MTWHLCNTHLGYGILEVKKSGIWDIRGQKSGIWDMGNHLGYGIWGLRLLFFHNKYIEGSRAYMEPHDY